jgi:hypothetical protein
MLRYQRNAVGRSWGILARYVLRLDRSKGVFQQVPRISSFITSHLPAVVSTRAFVRPPACVVASSRTNLSEAQVHSRIFHKHRRSPRLRTASVFLISIILGLGRQKPRAHRSPGKLSTQVRRRYLARNSRPFREKLAISDTQSQVVKVIIHFRCFLLDTTN